MKWGRRRLNRWRARPFERIRAGYGLCYLCCFVHFLGFDAVNV
jgi:hypothetical protein